VVVIDPGGRAAMTLLEFNTSLAGSAPPRQMSEPLRALWWAAKGDWDKAHQLAQDDQSDDAAWVHAYLHRLEGDVDNADYWYRRARRTPARGSLATEQDEIVGYLLTASA
jgi:hypothetical protein